MTSLLRAALAALILFGAAFAAFAHHGWSWTQDEFFELEGKIAAIYIGNPHATLDVEAEDGAWRVELAPLAATVRSGFVEGVAKIGDPVVAIGHRSRSNEERRMKAVRLLLNGNIYDVYPNRLPPS
jgi:hypothetical protein